jgi:tRNA(Ile)-lysidine synthase
MNPITAFFKKEGLRLAGQKIVVAASGGPDSMALLDLCRQTKATVIVAHVDHRLRPASQDETKLLAAYCDKYQLPFENYVWTTNPKKGLEAAARSVRYAFFKQVAQKYGAQYVATAHQADDVLENILLKLIRSGEPTEMASLQEVEHRAAYTLIRPLLTFSKQELQAYDEEHHLAFIEDATNAEDGTMRNRLRHHVVPLLKHENPQLLAHANRFCQSMHLLEQERADLFTAYPEAQYFAPGIFYFETSLRGIRLNEFLDWQALQLWGVRVHFNDQGQAHGFYYLLRKDRCFLINKKELVTPAKGAIELDRPFSFNGRKYLLSLGKKDDEVGHFYAEPNVHLSYGGLPQGSRLPLANGQHAKGKKFLAEAGVPTALGQYCLTIFSEKEPLFTLGVYQNQLFSPAFVRYSLLALVE